MADLKYNGSVYLKVYMGGIVAGSGITHNYGIWITNCVNYGSITNYGKSTSTYIEMGGIIGEFYKSGSYKAYVQNCANYGTVQNLYTGTNCDIGGIVGISSGNVIENCMSIGKISTSKGGNLGGIIGRVHDYTTTITHSYWTSNTGCKGQYGTSSSTENKVSLSVVHTDNLNEHAATYEWNEWTYNQNSANIKFVVHDGKDFLIRLN